MKFLLGKRLKILLGDDQNEVLGSQRAHGPEQEAPRSHLSGLLHEVIFKRISISIILLVILLLSGAFIMLLNQLLTG
jgi:hypothetical protein